MLNDILDAAQRCVGDGLRAGSGGLRGEQDDVFDSTGFRDVEDVAGAQMRTGTRDEQKERMGSVHRRSQGLGPGQISLLVSHAFRGCHRQRSSRYRGHLLTGRGQCFYEYATDVAGGSRYYDHERLLMLRHHPCLDRV
ncbi:hypothetical protein FMEAI12_4020102 [Parafrankia sp. Ea1.12]|nr:hypothetical protein FMEAI12_4020102 [Parafrankia sp. Ea1.12]